MTYEEASKIGTALDGYIKCTYAEIYKLGGSKMYAFQALHTRANQVYKDYAEQLGAFEPNSEKVAVTYQIPIVKAKAGLQVQGGKFVPVVLTDYARTLAATKSAEGMPATVVEKCIVTLHVTKRHTDALPYRQFDDWTYYSASGKKYKGMTEYYKGSKLVKEFYPDEWHREERGWKPSSGCPPVDWGYYTYETKYTWSPAIFQRNKQAVYDSLGGMLQVKECAIDWIPTDVKNVVDSDGVDINVKLQLSQKKLDQAKALLITAGVTNII